MRWGPSNAWNNLNIGNYQIVLRASSPINKT
ncbi:unnamed protein product [Callosobruchus maculatus]|uniref:Uncharacterized protein n=1 Tax=Callosobruchus maculatus TaxID=64391 RepID=A0A653BYA3_CALMS|nr:unnamed protein product [Callosobruchus maculatus]